MFQRSIGLPVTGQLTSTVIRRLRAAVAQARSVPVNDGFDDSASPSGAWAPAPPPASGPEPEPEPEPVDAAPAPDDDHLEPQEEFRLAVSGKVMLHRHRTLPLDDPAIDLKLPREPGLYVITTGPTATPWYVGMTDLTIRDRFRPRWKSLKDFNLGASDLKGRSITCYTFSTEPSIEVFYRPGTTGAFRARKGKKGILLALEEHFIQNLGTAARGNQQRSIVSFSPNVMVELNIAPATVPMHPLDSKIPRKMAAPPAAK